MKKVFKKLFKRSVPQHVDSSVCIPRSAHALSRQDLSENALKVLYRLHKKGFQAYLVGGGVRDTLLQKPTKDFDIATDATPEQIRDIFINSRIIGRRFRLVHVSFRGEIIEVSTFRGAQKNTEEDDARRFVRFDNTFGTIEEDAWRRDFSINALYYNIADFSIVDYTGGMQDLNNRCLRIIGDAEQRFHEDPVRLLRALRFAAKLDFILDADTEIAVRKLPHLLAHVPPSRLLLEFEKLFFNGHALQVFRRLDDYAYLAALVPSLPTVLEGVDGDLNRCLLEAALQSTDERYQQQKSLNPAFLLAALLWPALQQRIEKISADGVSLHQALHVAIAQVLEQQRSVLTIPRRYTTMMRSVWVLQYHFARRRPKRVATILGHRFFRAAIDLLELRARSGEQVEDLFQWWLREHKQNPVTPRTRRRKNYRRGKRE